MVDLYLFMIKTNKKNCGIYNAGFFENKSINQIASMVKKKIPSKIMVIKSKNDPRSYRLSSNKLLKIGFKPKGIIDAIKELKLLYFMKKLKDKPNYHSVSWLKKIINHA